MPAVLCKQSPRIGHELSNCCSYERLLILNRRDSLLRNLRVCIPRDRWRAGEWAIGPADTVSATACLKAETAAESLRSLVAVQHLRRSSADQLLALTDLGCWRHSVRIDSAGGISLYAERDWDRTLLRHLCKWFATPQVICEAALQLSCDSSFVIGGIGVHWSNASPPRLRLYTVAKRPTAGWQSSTRTIEALFRYYGLNRWISEVRKLLRFRRRACVVNLGMRAGALSIKLEIPDVRWCELPAMFDDEMALAKAHDIRQVVAAKLRYVGVRYEKNRREEPTWYFPVAVGGTR